MTAPKGTAGGSGAMRFAVIGAGAAGLVSLKTVLEHGHDCVVFEATNSIGGYWEQRYGHLYDNLRAVASRDLMAFSDFPFPKGNHPFPDSREAGQYLKRYADAHRLHRFLRFNTQVESVEPVDDDGDESPPSLPSRRRRRWRVRSVRSGSPAVVEEFDAVLVCLSPFVVPVIPKLQDAERFAGQIRHSSEVRDARWLADRRVLVVGGGGSAALLASAAVMAQARSVRLCLRSPAWILPFMLAGRPFDHRQSRLLSWLPCWLQGLLARLLVLKKLVPPSVRNSFPPMDLRTARITASNDLLPMIQSKSVLLAATPLRVLGPSAVEMSDGSVCDADVVLMCTGFQRRFRFLDRVLPPEQQTCPPLYDGVFLPDQPGLAFVGAARVRGAAWPVAELQARWAVGVLSGRLPLPPPERMRRAVADRQAKLGENAMTFANRIAYADRLAGYIGARPPLLSRLLVPLLLGPVTAAQFRLRGPHAWKGAAAEVWRLRGAAYGQLAMLLLLLVVAVAVVLSATVLGSCLIW